MIALFTDLKMYLIFILVFFFILYNRIILQFAVLIYSTKTLLIFPITGHAIKQCLDIRIWAYLDIAEEKRCSFIFGVSKTCIDEYKLFEFNTDTLKYNIKGFYLGYVVWNAVLSFTLKETWTTSHITKKEEKITRNTSSIWDVSVNVNELKSFKKLNTTKRQSLYKEKNAFFSGTSNFLGHSYFETALVGTKFQCFLLCCPLAI